MQKDIDIEKTFFDFLGIKENTPKYLDLNEDVIFSSKVKKINKFGFNQERILLLTNRNLYNVKKDAVQRTIPVESIKSVAKSMKGNSQEFLVNVRNEHSYRYESENRALILDAIKYACWKCNKVNLPVYGVPDKLKDLHISKKDVSDKKEIEILERYRLQSEDIYPLKKTADSEKAPEVSRNTSSPRTTEGSTRSSGVEESAAIQTAAKDIVKEAPVLPDQCSDRQIKLTPSVSDVQAPSPARRNSSSKDSQESHEIKVKIPEPPSLNG